MPLFDLIAATPELGLCVGGPVGRPVGGPVGDGARVEVVETGVVVVRLEGIVELALGVVAFVVVVLNAGVVLGTVVVVSTLEVGAGVVVVETVLSEVVSNAGVVLGSIVVVVVSSLELSDCFVVVGVRTVVTSAHEHGTFSLVQKT